MSSSMQDNLVAFARGVVALLRLWPALQIASSHHWSHQAHAGVPPETADQKRLRLAEELVDAFYTSTDPSGPDSGSLESFLIEFLEIEYGILIEDDSEVGMARDLRKLWSICRTDSGALLAIVDDYERSASRVSGHAPKVVNETGAEVSDEDDISGNDDDGMDVDSVATTSEVNTGHVIDEDGFELVQPKRKGRAPRAPVQPMAVG